MSARHVNFPPLTVGAVATRAGVRVSTLHFYESHGLISSTRNAGNQRRYARDTLRRIAFIRASQRVGIPLADIRAALDSLPQQRTPTAKDWARLADRWRERLDDSIDQLIRLRDDLDSCIGCGCLSLSACRLTNYNDHLAQEGAGARRFIPGSPRDRDITAAPDQAD